MSKSGNYLFISKKFGYTLVFVIGYKGNKLFSNFRFRWKKLLGKVLYKEDDVQEFLLILPQSHLVD